MKKLLLLVAVFTTVCITKVSAQGGNGQQMDPAARLAAMKERVSPMLVDKVKLTKDQADKVVEIRFNAQSQMRGLRDLSPEDRQKKMADMQADIEKQEKALPLTDDQVKAVQAFYDEMRKQQQQQRQNGGGNGNN